MQKSEKIQVENIFFMRLLCGFHFPGILRVHWPIQREKRIVRAISGSVGISVSLELGDLVRGSVVEIQLKKLQIVYELVGLEII